MCHPCPAADVAHPLDREAVRFVVLGTADRRGLQKIRVLAWLNGCRQVIEKTTSLDILLASARRRAVVFDVVDLTTALEAA